MVSHFSFGPNEHGPFDVKHLNSSFLNPVYSIDTLTFDFVYFNFTIKSLPGMYPSPETCVPIFLHHLASISFIFLITYSIMSVSYTHLTLPTKA